MAKSLKIPVSFKQNEKIMYEFLSNKLSPSVYIKELLIREMKKEGYKEEDQNHQKEKSQKKEIKQGFDF